MLMSILTQVKLICGYLCAAIVRPLQWMINYIDYDLTSSGIPSRAGDGIADRGLTDNIRISVTRRKNGVTLWRHVAYFETAWLLLGSTIIVPRKNTHRQWRDWHRHPTDFPQCTYQTRPLGRTRWDHPRVVIIDRAGTCYNSSDDVTMMTQ